MAQPRRISVLGAGAWGTALANVIARTGRPVTLYARDSGLARRIAEQRSNEKHLPGVAIEPEVTPTASLQEAAESEILLLVVPTQSTRALTADLAPLLRPAAALVACAKGIERQTGRFVTEILAEAAPGSGRAILSGPSFAADVARGLPTAVTLAAADEVLASDPLSRFPRLSFDRRSRR